MKEGKKEEAEAARTRVAELKEGNKVLDTAMTEAATELQNLLYTIPNVPYDEVPEGVGRKTTLWKKWEEWKPNFPKTPFLIGNWQKNTT